MLFYKNYYYLVIIYCEIEVLSIFKYIIGKKYVEFNLQIELYVYVEIFLGFVCFWVIFIFLNKFSFVLDFGVIVMQMMWFFDWRNVGILDGYIFIIRVISFFDEFC